MVQMRQYSAQSGSWIILAVCFMMTLSLVSANDTSLPPRREYDYIVVGGGTAGCVVAARLSEKAHHKVLLISTGTDQSGKPENQLPLVKPIMSNLPSDYPRFADSLLSTETDSIGKRSSTALLPRLLGGASSLNGGAFVRPDNYDYERITNEMGLSGWSVNKINQIWKKIETYHPFNASAPVLPGHGFNGPINTRAIPPEIYLDAFSNQIRLVTGSSINPDSGLGHVNGTAAVVRPLGGYPNATVTGDYIRQDSYTRYIVPILSRPNLDVIDAATVVKVEASPLCRLSHNNCIDTVKYIKDGESFKLVVKWGGEIILSAGALSTPKILMHSGIGECAHLASHGIDCVKDIPLLGKRVQDHIAISTIHYVAAPSPNWSQFMGSLVSTYTASVPGQPINLEITSTSIPASFIQLIITQVVVTNVKSTGSLNLKDSDWMTPLNVSFGFFKNDYDKQALAYGLKSVIDAADQYAAALYASTGKILARSSPSTCALSSSANAATYLKYVTDFATGDYHTVSTTPMGKCNQGSVVDQKLRVCGIKGLRVADNGVMPFAYTAHSTHSGAIIIAEQVARFITP